MICRDIINILELKYPKQNAEEWDNVGLIVGDRKKEIKKIQISLDATETAIDLAIENDVDMIITHHPMIFRGIKNIDFSTILGRKIMKLIKEDIVLYAAHTNLDSSIDGLNNFVVKLLGKEKTTIIDTYEDKEGVGIGRIYTLESETTISQYAELVKEKFKVPNIRVICEDESKKIKKIGFVNGSGMSYWRKAKSLGVDLFITGDIGYHDALDAKENKLNLIDLGHYESEICFVELIKEVLKDCELEITIFNDGPVFRIY